MRSLLWLILAGLLVAIPQATTRPISCDNPEKLDDYVQCLQVAMKVAEFVEGLLRDTSPNPNQPELTGEVTGKQIKKDAETFPYCSGLSVLECSDLLSMLEQLTQELQTSGLYANMLDSISKEVPERVKRQATEKKNLLQFLALYRDWKEAKQLAKRTSRWGRSVEQILARMTSDLGKQKSPNTVEAGQIEESTVPQTFLQYILEKYRINENSLESLRREKRETRRKLPSQLMTIIRAYKKWRYRNGYGKIGGWWGR